MTLHDFFLLFYCFIIFLSVPIGYHYVSTKTRKTGEFLPYLVISLAFALADGILSILIWIAFTSSMNTFMYIGGLLTGMIFTSLCGFFLLFVLLLRRSTFLDDYEESMKVESINGNPIDQSLNKK